jgi:hypothetical protein
MKKIEAVAGYGDLTQNPPVGAAAICSAIVYRDGRVMLDADDIERSFEDFKRHGNDPSEFWVIIRKLKFSTRDYVFENHPSENRQNHGSQEG